MSKVFYFSAATMLAFLATQDFLAAAAADAANENGTMSQRTSLLRVLQRESQEDEEEEVGHQAGWLVLVFFVVFVTMGIGCVLQNLYDRHANPGFIPHEERLRRQRELQLYARYGNVGSLSMMDLVRMRIEQERDERASDPILHKRTRQQILGLLDRTKAQMVLEPHHFVKGEDSTPVKTEKDPADGSEGEESGKEKENEKMNRNNSVEFGTTQDDGTRYATISFESKSQHECSVAPGSDVCARSETLSFSNLCAICLESYQVGQTVCHSPKTSCSHCFHLECVAEYLTLAHMSRINQPSGYLPCPCCRQNFVDISSLTNGQTRSVSSEEEGIATAEPPLLSSSG